ncbi:hypothetical protein LIER_15494 [Lithospermum erythrorhizon]|uniref:Uncharacterized protein n=1 Tax=Lithospermum erythrorhizon TaxID=34254 RepID=A0AAV3Q453_LITER
MPTLFTTQQLTPYNLACNCNLIGGAPRFVGTGSLDGKVGTWDSLSGACMRSHSGHTDAVQPLALSGNGDHLVSCALDQTARVFQVAEFKYKSQMEIFLCFNNVEARGFPFGVRELYLNQ